MQKIQLSWPVPIGECFDTLSGNLREVMKTAVRKILAGQYDFESYREARSSDALAVRLDELYKTLD